MERINLKNVLLQWPFIYDMNLMEEKGLADKNGGNERFIKILNNYKFLLEKYLIIKTSIKEFDNILCESTLNLKPLSNNNMDYYQRTSTMNLKYFYLRNNLNIEKLTNNELDYLELLDYDNLELDENATALIEHTYKNVINPIEDSNDNKSTLCYGPDSKRFAVNVNDLVFGVRYDEFARNNLNDEEWLKNSFEQTQLLLKVMKGFEETLSNELNMNVKTIQYNEFNVHDNYSYYEVNEDIKQK